jgi:NADH-quinone oxidoreductase subunit F
VFPGGLSMGVLRGDIFPKNPTGGVDVKKDCDELDCLLDFDDVRQYDLLGLGTAAAVVVPEDADIRDVLLNVTRFYAHESCGQCTQCREGTGWMYRIARRIRVGAGRVYDLDLLAEISQNMGMMPGLSICGLPDGAAWPIRTLAQKFRVEFERHIAAQAPDAALRWAKRTNPAAYELPVMHGRAREYQHGTMLLPDQTHYTTT